jgi:adenine-specific DNA-methyltransferase
MQKLTAADPETKSPDLAAANIAALRALFPELLTEGQDGVAVNLDVLKQLVGDKTVTDAEEKYGLNWHGKRRARQLALTPSTGTLRPCPADSVDWDTTQNITIEGDNLEVLKLLQKSYAGKVKLIYIDPPYNTGKDFVYPDNFRDNISNYLELTGQTSEGGKKLSSNTEASGRFHTDWLNMMYPRLKLARNLLREDGVIFISIDDGELSDLRTAANDIFGEENFLACFVWKSRQNKDNRTVTGASVDHEYVLCFGKSIRGASRNLSQYSNPDGDKRGDWASANMVGIATADRRPNLHYDLINPSTRVNYGCPEMGWRYEPSTMARLVAEDRILWPASTEGRPRRKAFVSELDSDFTGFSTIVGEGVFTRDGTADVDNLFNVRIFDFPKPVQLISSLIEQGSQKGDIILDFFAGSGTTGQGVMAQNVADRASRRYILVQLPEPIDSANRDQKTAADFCDKLSKPRTIAELTKERLRRAGKKIREENPLFAGDLGFRVFKLASSNIREWDPNRENLAETLEASIEHLKTDRTEQDILFELLLKLGLDLCVPIETRIFYHEKHESHEKGGDQKVEAMMSLHPQDFRAFRVFRGSPAESPEGSHTVHSIGGGSLLVCLSKFIPQADVEPLALGLVAWHKELKPAGETTVVFRDSAFADDVAKTNLTAILNQHGLETVRSL